jgi:hypothetical protein
MRGEKREVKENAKIQLSAKEIHALWPAGGYGHSFGRYRAVGVMKAPLPEIYVEE